MSVYTTIFTNVTIMIKNTMHLVSSCSLCLKKNHKRTSVHQLKNQMTNLGMQGQNNIQPNYWLKSLNNLEV